jgi:hypothetical protein
VGPSSGDLRPVFDHRRHTAASPGTVVIANGTTPRAGRREPAVRAAGTAPFSLPLVPGSCRGQHAAVHAQRERRAGPHLEFSPSALLGRPMDSAILRVRRSVPYGVYHKVREMQDAMSSSGTCWRVPDSPRCDLGRAHGPGTAQPEDTVSRSSTDAARRARTAARFLSGPRGRDGARAGGGALAARGFRPSMLTP